MDEDDEKDEKKTDRAYWEKRGSPDTVAMADQLLEMVKTLDPHFDLNYTQSYIGLARDGQPFNFVVCRPQKSSLRIDPRLEKSDELENRLKDLSLSLRMMVVAIAYIVLLVTWKSTQNSSRMF